MKIQTLIAIALLRLVLSSVANGQGKTIVAAYEVVLSDFRPPATSNGGAAFKACRECERQLVRVTAATRYSVNGKTVRLDDFRSAVATARDRDRTLVLVLHHLESDTLKSIDVSLR